MVGPTGLHTSQRRDLQPRVEEATASTMQPPEGAAFHITGEFREVDPPRRLVYTFEYEDRRIPMIRRLW